MPRAEISSLKVMVPNYGIYFQILLKKTYLWVAPIVSAQHAISTPEMSISPEKGQRIPK